MSARLSASGIARALACPASYALPIATEDSAGARRGRARHLALAALAQGGTSGDAVLCATEEAFGLPPAEREATLREVRGINPRQVPQGEPEVAMAYDVITGKARRLTAEDRRYDVTDTEIPGTADLVQWDASPIGVIDWKGQWTADEDHRPQTELYALMAARIAGVQAVQCMVVAVGEKGALGVADKWLLDWEDLARITQSARRAWESVESARAARDAHERAYASPWLPDVAIGPQCRYCACARYCPAQRAAVAVMLMAEEVTALHDANVITAVELARSAEQAADRARAAAKLYVLNNGPATSDDGRVLRIDGAGRLGFGKKP